MAFSLVSAAVIVTTTAFVESHIRNGSTYSGATEDAISTPRFIQLGLASLDTVRATLIRTPESVSSTLRNP